MEGKKNQNSTGTSILGFCFQLFIANFLLSTQPVSCSSGI